MISKAGKFLLCTLVFGLIIVIARGQRPSPLKGQYYRVFTSTNYYCKLMTNTNELHDCYNSAGLKRTDVIYNAANITVENYD